MSTEGGEIELRKGDALIAIDVQNDFLPGGSLAVNEGDAVIPVLNRYMARFAEKQLPIFATRDWHPTNHCSFQTEGGPWPVHCLAGSKGAEFSSKLSIPPGTVIRSKATAPEYEAYSDFERPDFEKQLRESGVERLFIGGLATDYCVLHTVRDALSRGFKVFLLVDGIRAVNVKPDDGANAELEMTRRGAVPITLKNLAN